MAGCSLGKKRRLLKFYFYVLFYFRLEDEILDLNDIIGRSLVVSEVENGRNKKISCGIIARSAGVFQNAKTICACDGVSIWDEGNTPKVK